MAKTDILTITSVEKKYNTITVYFSFSGRWTELLDDQKITNIYDENIESVPDSIAIVPALCNLLPLAWVFDLTIKVKNIDKTFQNAIPKILGGYKKMYPNMKFGGKIYVESVTNTKYKTSRVGTLYSGGVDATFTAYRHLHESPDIITVLGSDIRLSDESGIATVNENNHAFAKSHNLEYKSIYSTFRSFLSDEGRHFKESPELRSYGYGWWHEFQHGIGLIGLVAPLSYVRGYSVVYIASSYHVSQKGKYTCASDPLIDNQIKYGATTTFHDGYEMTRQDKIKYICDYADEHNLKPYLRVCWESAGGENCCHCEKCRRTYIAIMAEKHDPANFGLPMTRIQYRRMIRWFKRHLKYKYDKAGALRYGPIQASFNRNWSNDETPKNLKWFRRVNICGGNKLPLRVKIIDRIRKKLNLE